MTAVDKLFWGFLALIVMGGGALLTLTFMLAYRVATYPGKLPPLFG